MLDGRIDTKGTIKELEELGVLDSIIEDSTLEKQEPEGVKTPRSDDAETVAEAVLDDTDGKPTDGAEETHARMDTETTAVAGDKDKKKKARKLVKDEERARGNVKWKIYKTYLEAVGWFTWFWLGVFICGYQVRADVSLQCWILMPR